MLEPFSALYVPEVSLKVAKGSEGAQVDDLLLQALPPVCETETPDGCLCHHRNTGVVHFCRICKDRRTAVVQHSRPLQLV